MWIVEGEIGQKRKQPVLLFLMRQEVVKPAHRRVKRVREVVKLNPEYVKVYRGCAIFKIGDVKLNLRCVKMLSGACQIEY